MSPVVIAAAYGGPEVLELTDQASDPPGPGQVLVDVRAAGVNPIDWKLYGGMRDTDPARLPLRVGFEAAGIVTAVGEAPADGPAGPVAVGDAVIVYPATGAYAGQLVVPATAVVPKPDALGFEQAAGLMLAGTTAIHLVTATGVAAGDTVLVHAASGGVGRMAVQVAVARGARVIGTASPAGHEALRALGAEPVAYGPGLADRVQALAPDGVDVALDCVGGDEALDVSLELVADRGRIATIAAFQRGAREAIKLLGGGPGADPGTAIRQAARLELTQLAVDGKLTVAVEAFPLADVAEVHRRAMRGHTQGKLVLLP